MPYQEHADGLYLVRQRNNAKSIDHYGIVDIGNRIKHPQANNGHPVVIHQTPPNFRLDWLQDTGLWEVLGKITDESTAIQRISEAAKNPRYDLFGNNCEHFARYVATGKRESRQLQAVGVVVGLAVLAFQLK